MQIQNREWPAAVPPRIEEVRIYFSQKGMNAREAEDFFLFYESRQWRSKNGRMLTNWKSIAHGWIMSAFKAQPWLFDKNIH